MSQYSNLLAVLLLMIAGCVIDLMMALKCYLVADGIKGREGVQLWFRQRAGVLVGLGVFYLLYAGFTVTLDLIPAGALSPKHNSFVAQIVRLFSMLARYSGVFIVLFVIVGGFVVDLYLAVRSYKGMDDLHGGEARLSWFQQRLGLMIVAGGLYILFVVLFYSDLFHLSGLRQGGITAAKKIFTTLTGINPILSALGVLFLCVSGFSLDLYWALRSSRGMDNLKGREARREWFQQRRLNLAGACLLYFLFVVLFFSDLFHLSHVRKEFVHYVKGFFSYLAVVGPYKSAIIVFIFLVAGAVLDLFIAMKVSRGLDNLHGREAVKDWFRQRTLRICIVTVFFGGFVWLVVFTDLVRLPGIRYENKEYVDNAKEYLQHGKYREGALELRNALQKNPDDRVVRFVLAKTLLRLKDYAGAEKEFSYLINLDGVSYEYRYGLAQVMLSTKRKEGGLAELREAIRLQPSVVEPHLLLARVYLADKNYLQAVQECRLALGYQQDSRPARELLVTVALAGRFYDEAAREAQVGRGSDATDIKMWLYEAQALIGLGRGADAERVLREAAAVNPLVADPWFVLADFLAGRNVITSAMECYEEGLKRDPQNLSAMNNLAQLHADQGRDLVRAQELAAFVNWKQPDNPAYADTLGWILVKMNKTRQAIPLLQTAVRKIPHLPGPHYHLGVALMQSGNSRAGRIELAKALKISSTFDGAAQARALLAKS